jgi:glycosyltransferase involved in cell wall biosynthesis
VRICYVADGRSVHFHRWVEFFAQRHSIYFISHHPLSAKQIEEIQSRGAIYVGELGGFHVKRFWRTVHNLHWLRGRLRHNNIDVLHCHFIGSNCWYAALTGFHPLVLTVMGGGDVCGPKWRPIGFPQRVLTPLALRKADLITSWSRQMVEVIRPYCKSSTPIIFVHGGIDLQQFYPGPKPTHLLEKWGLPNDCRIAFSPRIMRPLSNIEQIAHAAVSVSRRCPNVYFLFASPPYAVDIEYENLIRKVLADAGIMRHVRFIGDVPHGGMPDYYRLADITISVPSTDGTPMSVLESMASGTPVVVANIPDYDTDYIDVGKTVLAVSPGDSEGLSDALVELLENSKLRSQLSLEAQVRVQKSGRWENQMSLMEQLYEERYRVRASAMGGAPAR